MESTKKVAKEMGRKLKKHRAEEKKDELCIADKQQCAAMKMALDGSGKNGIHWDFMLEKNQVKNLITYHPTKVGAKTMLLNYCPWCGRTLKPPKEK